jgi:hypothetical protein
MGISTTDTHTPGHQQGACTRSSHLYFFPAAVTNLRLENLPCGNYEDREPELATYPTVGESTGMKFDECPTLNSLHPIPRSSLEHSAK